MKVVVKDLEFYGESGPLLLSEIHDLVLKKKESVLNYVVKNLSVDELVLMNFLGEHALPTFVENLLNELKSLEKVTVVSSSDIYKSILLPENVEVIEEYELQEDFSSSPINNYPKVLAGENIINIEIPPLWVEVLDPKITDPVGKIEEFIKKVEKGNVIVVLKTVLTKAEREAIESLAKETGGFVVDVLTEFVDPLDDIEMAFSKRITNRMEKLLGLKMLRGERP